MTVPNYQEHSGLLQGGAQAEIKKLLQGLKTQKGQAKNEWAKKYIKRIQYSKEKVSVTLLISAFGGHKPGVSPERGAGKVEPRDHREPAGQGQGCPQQQIGGQNPSFFNS